MSILKNYIIFFTLLLLFACNQKKEEVNTDAVSTNDSLKSEFSNIKSISETLSPEAKAKTVNWEDYHQLDRLLTDFYTISPKEALNLSKELATTTTRLKDSLPIEEFKRPDVMIRINVLNNYALRLADMASIPSITDTEVDQEIQHLLDSYSALNAKINNIAHQEKIERELSDFEDSLTPLKEGSGKGDIVNKTLREPVKH